MHERSTRARRSGLLILAAAIALVVTGGALAAKKPNPINGLSGQHVQRAHPMPINGLRAHRAT